MVLVALAHVLAERARDAKANKSNKNVNHQSRRKGQMREKRTQRQRYLVCIAPRRPVLEGLRKSY